MSRAVPSAACAARPPGSWRAHTLFSPQALSVGIFPYVLKLLQSSARELRPLLVFIWAKILAVDSVSSLRPALWCQMVSSGSPAGHGQRLWGAAGSRRCRVWLVYLP